MTGKVMARIVDNHCHLDHILRSNNFKTDLAEQYLINLVTHQHYVALGEIDIDLTTYFRCNPCVRPEACKERLLQTQQDVLADDINLTRYVGKPVILNCRDDGSSEAAKRAFAMIRMMNMTHHAFHRYCFRGSVEELRQSEMSCLQ
ncbi:uncharacterized protein LOC134262104 [Saccostrea cucullata]|uniref:uncharacterized protein LOC134262104 n=1 Tax=Saccostrea cuccullata TaxID=36930 RepID=UPI002ED5D0E7